MATRAEAMSRAATATASPRSRRSGSRRRRSESTLVLLGSGSRLVSPRASMATRLRRAAAESVGAGASSAGGGKAVSSAAHVRAGAEREPPAGDRRAGAGAQDGSYVGLRNGLGSARMGVHSESVWRSQACSAMRCRSLSYRNVPNRPDAAWSATTARSAGENWNSVGNWRITCQTQSKNCKKTGARCPSFAWEDRR